MADQSIIQRFAFWNPTTWAIPTLYWDAFSNEQRFHAICKQLGKVIGYADYLGVNVNDIAERLKAIEEGQLDPLIIAEIEQWFEDNQPAIVQAISNLDDALPINDFDSNHTVSDALDALNVSVTALQRGKIITVEDYGAIGDGVTDSTAAIQQAIAENPNCIIAFRGGRYIISDTIHCWGNRGGQEIDLGGSRINWNGDDDKPVFLIDGDYSLAASDYLYDYLYTNPTESECKIENGTIYAGDYGIVNWCFHTILDNLKILDASKAAIVLGKDGTHISMQAKVTDILIMRSSSGSTYWSEEAEVLSLSLLTAPCGILCNDPDSNFSDINCNRYSVAVRIKAGGHTFENCHFTCEYKNQLGALGNSASVVFDLWNATGIYTDLFDTCYFDNPKYCFYAEVEPRHTINVTDGFYFNVGHQVDSGSTYYEAFMAKGITYLSVRDFNVVAGSRCRFYPAKLMISGASFNGLALCNEEYIPNIYTQTDSAFVFYGASMKCIDGRAYNIIRRTNSLTSGDTQCVGCLMLNGDSINRFNAIRFTISNRAYLWATGTIRYNGSNLVIQDEIVHGVSVGMFSLWIGEAETVTLDGNECMMFPIYIHANSTFTNTPVYMSFTDTSMTVTPFLNNQSFKPHTSGAYAIQHDFVVS